MYIMVCRKGSKFKGRYLTSKNRLSKKAISGRVDSCVKYKTKNNKTVRIVNVRTKKRLYAVPRK